MKCTLLKISVFIFLFIRPSLIHAQNLCECNLLNEINSGIPINPRDSTQVFKTSKILLGSNSDICIFQGINLEFEYLIGQKLVDEALVRIERQQQLLSEKKCPSWSSLVLLNFVKFYRAKNNFEKLSEYVFRALEESKRNRNTEVQIETLKQIVFLFTRMREPQKKDNYFKKAEELIVSNKLEEFTAVKNLRWLAYQMETKYVETGRKSILDSVFDYSNKALNLAKKYGLNDEMTLLYRALEAVSYHRKDFDLALVYIDSAIRYGKLIKGNKNLSGLYLSKSWNHFDLKQYEFAAKSMDTALIFDNKNDIVGHMMLLIEASEIYEGTGEIQKAYNSLKNHRQIKDSVLKNERIQFINELETKYETRLKDADIKDKQNQIRFLAVLILLALLAISVVVFISKQKSVTNQLKLLQIEQRLNRARMNPHFFFNGMASLQNLALQEMASKTSDNIANFAKIMRQSLEMTYQELVTLSEEITFMEKYLEIQLLRYPGRFNHKINVNKTIDVYSLKVPSMIIQPFLENSIEHGFKNISEIGFLNVDIWDEKDGLQIAILDNGKGFVKKNKFKHEKSRALQITKDRLFLLNKQYKSNATFRVDNSPKNGGVAIMISLPILR